MKKANGKNYIGHFLCVDDNMKLIEYEIDGYNKKHINQLNHYKIQQVRIPLQEKISLKKICQIF